MKRKRLSKKEVQDALSQGATLHEEYTSQIKSNILTRVGSYKGLDLISDKLEHLGIEATQKMYYDHLVAYTGEVIKRRINGFWKINTTHAGGNYPYIAVEEVDHFHYMPTNVVWYDMTPARFINLRKTTADEVRRYPLLKYYRETKSRR